MQHSCRSLAESGLVATHAKRKAALRYGGLFPSRDSASLRIGVADVGVVVIDDGLIVICVAHAVFDGASR